MAKPGRPKVELDWEKIGELAKFQCTQYEIACFFDISTDTLTRRYLDEFGTDLAVFLKEKRESGRVKLRVKQMQVALGGNVSMLIFLGKNYLGQADKTESIVQSDNVNQELYPAMTKDQARLIVQEKQKQLAEEEAKNAIKESIS